MKKALYFVLAILLYNPVKAQIVDDFDDNDLSSAPQWQGVNLNFINTNGGLKSNSNTANTQFGLSTNLNLNGDLEWRLNVKLSFNPSSLNYIDFFMFADSLNIAKSRNGIFVRMGGSLDEISLFKLNNGTESKIIDGKDAVLNVSSSQYTLSIICKNDTVFLYHQKQGLSSMSLEGKCPMPFKSFEPYTGIRVRQSTSSFFFKHNFDNLYIGPLLRDTLAPKCDSLQILSHRALKCYFSEGCDSLSLINKANYRLNNSQSPDSVVYINQSSVIIYFKDSFLANQASTLNIQQVKDYFANKLNQTVYFTYYLTAEPSHWDILLSEMMVDPDPALGLPNAEYVELYNASKKYIDLGQLKLSDPSVAVSLPPYILHPDSFFLVYKIPSLNNASDEISLSTASGISIDAVNYQDSWYRDAKKMQGGYSLERIDLSRPCLGQINWKASASTVGGTPGKVNSVKGVLPPDTSAPRLLNTSTRNEQLMVFSFDEPIDTVSGFKFKLNGRNIDLKLLSVQGFHYTFKWPYILSKDSVYQLQLLDLKDCEQNTVLVQSLVFQWPSNPMANEIVVNELLFNPRSNGKDFVELYNNSNKSFDFSSLFFVELDPSGNIVQYYPLSPSYKIFPPHTYALVSEDTLSICQNYKCPKSEGVFVQCRKLMPLPDSEGQLVLVNVLNHTIDSLSYTADWHFKFLNDQNGVSLERLSFQMLSNDPNNWHSAAASRGYASPAAQNSQIEVQIRSDMFFSLNTRSLSPDMDGFEDLLILRYQFPGADYLSTIKIFNIEGREMKTIINNKTLGTEGAIVWDGTDANGEVLPIGVYLVLIECMSPEGEIRREKLSVLLSEMF